MSSPRGEATCISSSTMRSLWSNLTALKSSRSSRSDEVVPGNRGGSPVGRPFLSLSGHFMPGEYDVAGDEQEQRTEGLPYSTMHLWRSERQWKNIGSLQRDCSPQSAQFAKAEIKFKLTLS